MPTRKGVPSRRSSSKGPVEEPNSGSAELLPIGTDLSLARDQLAVQSARVETSGTFSDRATEDEAYWSVRSTPIGIVLALSLRSDGDIQVVLDRETATSLARALLDVAADLR